MSVPVGFAMEADDPAMMDDVVDDRGGDVPVSEHIAPSAELEVRCVCSIEVRPMQRNYSVRKSGRN